MNIDQLIESLNAGEQWHDDGRVKLDNLGITPSPNLRIIEGDVGTETGNIKTDGNLLIKGSVGQQYSVKCGGIAVICNRVEAGAQIFCKGDLIISGRVVGRQTNVLALGHIFLRGIEEATVQCSKDLWFGESLSYANVRTGGKLKTPTDGKGFVKGGEVWALNKIEVATAGSEGHSATMFTSGVDPIRAKDLDKCNKALAEASKLIMKQLLRFNMDRIDIKLIKERLSKSSGPQKRILTQAAHILGQQIQSRQQSMAEKKRILDEALSSLDDDGGMLVWGQVYPGVQIQMGEHNFKVEDKYDRLFTSIDSGAKTVEVIVNRDGVNHQLG
ncbi:MAG: hypothetical protein ACI906_004393 [Candidatus Latescibacterota bacterium]|jgi:uncharacterized protein (DUF342 family)